MQEENIKKILAVFLTRVIEISKKYGMGQVFIQGQLEEASHQLKLHYKKMNRGVHHGF